LSRPAVKKIQILKIHDGGGRDLEKLKNCRISTAFWLISTKFGAATLLDPLEPFDH